MTSPGLAIAGPVTDILGPQTWYLIAGMAAVTAGVGGFFIPVFMQIEQVPSLEVVVSSGGP